MTGERLFALQRARYLRLQRTRFYRTRCAWNAMWRRCTNPKYKGAHNYVGITVCRRWRSFDNFLADMGLKPLGRFSLDRKNNKKGYTPSNCRWASPEEQQNNKRTTRRVRAFGQTLSVSQWSRVHGVPIVHIKWRLNHGWSNARAVSEKPAHGKRWTKKGA